jgi:HD-like signal output (HDOD) protein
MASTSPISIRELLSGNVQLASPPEVFLKLNQAINDPTKTLADIAHLIQHDPGLSARLLKIVNSPFYGFPTRVTSISHAVGIIGFRELRDLVIATLVIDKFASLPNGLVPMRQFWMSSVRCALTARVLATKSAHHKRLDNVFLGGLLHEIGRLVIYQRLPELARAALLQSRVENITEHAAQRRVIGVDQYEVGAELARRWRLPDVVVTPMDYHDAPLSADTFPAETAIVCIANGLSHIDVNNPNELSSFLETSADIWGAASIDPNGLQDILAEVELGLLDVFRLFYQS